MSKNLGGKRLKALKGIKTYNINPISNWIKISFDPNFVSTGDAKKAIVKCEVTDSIVKK